jgi:hypothetical protein
MGTIHGQFYNTPISIWGIVLTPDYNKAKVWRMKTGEGGRKCEGATNENYILMCIQTCLLVKSKAMH